MSSRDHSDDDGIDGVRRRILQTTAGATLALAGCQQTREKPTDGPGGTSPEPTDVERTVAPVEGTAPFDLTYELSSSGQVSAAVYDADGTLVRELRRGVEREAGQHTIEWDGLDQRGNPVDPGDYEFRVLRTPEFQAEFVTQVGAGPSSGTHRKWVGNHDTPNSVAVLDGDLFIAANGAEGVPILHRQSLGGDTVRWEHVRYQPGAGAQAMATAGDTLYFLQDDAKVQVVDPDDGQRTDPYTIDVLPGGANRGETAPTLDVAFADGAVVISDSANGAVRWYEPDGSLRTSADVDGPTAVAASADTVYAATESAVVEVAADGSTATVVDGLPTPASMTVDPTTDDLLVATGGDDHRVHRLSTDGERAEAYGREGGRQYGAYEGGDFRGVVDIEATGDGGFVVAEPHAPPRRAAHFDADGQLVGEWFGGTGFFTWAAPDPEEPTNVWYHLGSSFLVLASVDVETGTWEVHETYDLGEMADGLVQGTSGHSDSHFVRYHDGTRYLVSRAGPQVFRHEEGALTPVLLSGDANYRNSRLERARELAGESGGEGFVWTDTNGDGAVGADEIALLDTKVPSGSFYTDDFAAIGHEYTKPSDSTTEWHVTRLDVESWADGTPRYPTDPEAVSRFGTVPFSYPGRGLTGEGLHVDDEGRVFSAFRNAFDRHGNGWPTNICGICRIVGFDADGTFRFSVGRHAVDPPGDIRTPDPPGHMHQPAGLIGDTNGTIVFCDRSVTPAAAWTKDGLYAGAFFDDRADDGLPGTVYNWFRDPETGNGSIINYDMLAEGAVIEREDDVLWYAPGWNSVPVYRVHGWSGWERVSGDITVGESTSAVDRDGSGLGAAYYDTPDLSGSPAVERTDERVWGGIPNDEGGDAVVDGWRAGPVYSWVDGPVEGVTKPFSVRWTGEVEPQLSEPTTFSVYARGGARLWVDGELVIDTWTGGDIKTATKPIDVTAGERLPVQLEYKATGGKPACSLNWESRTQDRQRVPTDYLYPERPGPTQTPPPVTEAGPITIPKGALDVDASFDDARARDPTLQVEDDLDVVSGSVPPDYAGPLWWTWDEEALYIAANLRDDSHIQNNIDKNFFTQDCIQWGISGAEASVWDEGELALTPEGPKVAQRRFTSPYDTADEPSGVVDFPVAIERDEENNRTKYEAAFPWDALNASPDAGEVLLNIGLVDDEFGKLMEWGGGIFGTKSNTEYKLVKLGDQR